MTPSYTILALLVGVLTLAYCGMILECKGR
jgi:hypothetical protein